MKAWIIVLSSISLGIASQAWANNDMTDTYANVDIYAMAGEPLVEVEAAAAPVLVEPPKLSRQDNAILNLSLIRDEVDAMKQSGFFGGFFASDAEIQDTLLQEIDLFLTVYHDLPIAAEALHLRGVIQHKQSEEEAAVVSWLQTLFEYPDSDAALRARQSIQDTIDKDWDDYASEIAAILKKVPAKDTATRLSVLISQLYPLEDKALTTALRHLQLDFLKRFSNSQHADEVQILMAHNMGAESAQSGIFGFKKLLALYPNSLYRPEAMLAIADLQRLRLKEYEKAANNYKILIGEYPNHALSKHAYEHLAFTQAEHLKKYADSIATYQTIVTKYPDDKLALKALQNTAQLQERKTGEPEKAVATLRKLATMFHGFEATDALSDAIKIAEKRLKDSKLAFEIRQQLVKDYPNSDEAPKALFDMAEHMEKSGDHTQAKALYKQLIQQYPDEKRLIKQARERI